MSERRPPSPEQAELQHPSMVDTLAAQAEMIWPLERPVLDRLGLPEAGLVVDLGCGTAEIASRVAATWPSLRVLGIDVFEGHVARGRARHGHLTNLELVVGDARDTGLPDGAAGAVLVRHLLHALSDPGAVLREARRVLRPDGLLWVLAEDYAGLLFDAERPEDAALFLDAHPGVLPTGTNLLHGRAVRREMVQAGFRDVRAVSIVVDTDNAPRDAWARMLRAWDEGYRDFLARALRVPSSEVGRRFDGLVACVEDETRYAAWLLPGVSGRR